MRRPHRISVTLNVVKQEITLRMEEQARLLRKQEELLGILPFDQHAFNEITRHTSLNEDELHAYRLVRNLLTKKYPWEG